MQIVKRHRRELRNQYLKTVTGEILSYADFNHNIIKIHDALNPHCSRELDQSIYSGDETFLILRSYNVDSRIYYVGQQRCAWFLAVQGTQL